MLKGVGFNQVVYLKLLTSICLNLLYFALFRTVGFMLFCAISQGALLLAINLMIDVWVGKGKNIASADELIFVGASALVFLLGQYLAKALVVGALSRVHFKFQLKTKNKSGFMAPLLVESRQLLLSIPRIIVALLVLVIVTHNFFILIYVPIIAIIYCYSAVKIEQKIKSEHPMPVWDRLKIQNISELIFALFAIILCVSSIMSKNTLLSLGDYGYLLVAFRVLISDLSNAGYSLPRQIKNLNNLPNWPAFFSAAKIWR